MNLVYVAALDLRESDAANCHVRQMCRHWVELGHSVTLFAPRARDLDPASLPPGLAVVQVPACSGTRWLRTLSFYAALGPRLAAHLAKRPVDVVYTRCSYLEWIAFVWLKRAFRFLYVGEINGLRSLETTRGPRAAAWIRRMERTAFRRMDAAVTVTPELRKYLLTQTALEPTRVAVVPNGVDVNLFRPIPRSEAIARLALDPRKRYIAFVGSMKPWHALEDLVAAFRLVAQQRPDAQLLLVGDGPSRPAVEARAQQHGVAARVTCVGSRPQEEVPLYLAASAFCVAPFAAGRNQTTGVSPLKLYEYMACARAVVVAELGASTEFVARERCGRVYPIGDIDAFARAMTDLLDSGEADRLGEAGRRVAVERHSWRRLASQISDLMAQWIGA